MHTSSDVQRLSKNRFEPKSTTLRQRQKVYQRSKTGNEWMEVGWYGLMRKHPHPLQMKHKLVQKHCKYYTTQQTFLEYTPLLKDELCVFALKMKNLIPLLVEILATCCLLITNLCGGNGTRFWSQKRSVFRYVVCSPSSRRFWLHAGNA